MNPDVLNKILIELQKELGEQHLSPDEWTLVITELRKDKVKLSIPYDDILVSGTDAITLIDLYNRAETTEGYGDSIKINSTRPIKWRTVSQEDYADAKMKTLLLKDP